MMAIITRDQYLYTGLKSVFPDCRLSRFDRLCEFSGAGHKADTVIIDLLCGEGLSLRQAKKIGKLDAGNIFILSVFRASRMKSLSPVHFIPRNTSPALMQQLTVSPDTALTITDPVFSVMQIEVARQWHVFQDEERTAAHLGVSAATVRIHKYHVMLKLRLKKMSHMVNTEFHHYITDGDPPA